MTENRMWAPQSWRSKKADQFPVYPDTGKLEAVEKKLSSYPPIVFAGECRQLKERLAQVASGEAFLLQGGDCAESFEDFKHNTIRDNFRILLQMAIVLTYRCKRPVVKVGRVAGQFAKPRSGSMESRDGTSLPIYRGDIINGHEFNAQSRTPDPTRMERAYFQSSATLNLLRAFSHGGFADLNEVHAWNLNFVKGSPQNALYERVADRLDETLAFIAAMGLNRDTVPQIGEIEFYTSHEALLLPYEQSLTRTDPTSARPNDGYEGDWYAGSAHMLWLGERTRDPDGAHVEYLRGVKNPIGVKCGPTMTPDQLMVLLDRLNPSNEPGRITLISRMGCNQIKDSLTPLIRKVKSQGRSVVWCCDPMHGNTVTASNGYKTRSFTQILNEVRSFFEIHQSEGTYAGGVHIELTGKDVVECTGGDREIREEHLGEGLYETLCDPRLNARQALQLAFELCG
jgi:3-deoxy-7-phosphoheptulonate synthase